MLEIRNATPEDLQLLKNMYQTEIEDHEERATTFAKELIHHFKTLLAIKDGKLCGTASWEIRGGLDDGVVELTSIGVNASYHRQGVATRLVETLTNEATQYYSEGGYKLRVILLFMEKQNTGARDFYSSIGFTESATLEELYPNDDGSIWTRKL
jgi:ribosomal protein S18 acetylase RimI-like enzyme